MPEMSLVDTPHTIAPSPHDVWKTSQRHQTQERMRSQGILVTEKATAETRPIPMAPRPRATPDLTNRIPRTRTIPKTKTTNPSRLPPRRPHQSPLPVRHRRQLRGSLAAIKESLSPNDAAPATEDGGGGRRRRGKKQE